MVFTFYAFYVCTAGLPAVYFSILASSVIVIAAVPGLLPPLGIPALGLAHLPLTANAAPTPALFTSKLICADCGHPLVANRETQHRKNGTVKKYTYCYCSRFATTGHSVCSWHRIYEITLKNLVLDEIKAHAKAVMVDENAVLDKLKKQASAESAARRETIQQEIGRLRRRVQELKHMTAKL